MTSPSHFTTITGKARLSAYLYLIGLCVVRIHTYRQKKNKTEALTHVPNSSKYSVGSYNFVMRTENYDI